MWRLILVTFAFLAVAFYELSGGSDYAPGQNSIQVQGLQRAAPSDTRLTALDAQEAKTHEIAQVSRAAANLADLRMDEESRFSITLATVSASNDYDSTAALPKVERVAATPDAIDAAVEDAVAADAAPEPDQPESVATGFVGEEVFSLETYVMRQSEEYTIPESGTADVAHAAGGDLRRVTGKLVNMRSGPGTDYGRVGRLSEGTEITVLEEPGNGWVMLEVVETGEIGWMADWLLTAAN